MPSIAVITDTDSSLPADLAKRLGIRQVPITIHFGADAMETGVDVDDARVFQRIDREGRIPTTAAPSPGRFAEAFQAALDGGAERVLCLCISSEVSAVCQSARTAAGLFDEGRIAVVDSRSLSMGLGFMAVQAAEMAAAGARMEEILPAVESVRNRAHLFASLATLKYLALSGRVGHLTAGLAALVELKPVLTIRNGKLEMLEKVRTQKKSWARAVELAAAQAGGRPLERLAIIHVNAQEEAQAFERQARERLECACETVFAELTPGLSVHAGAGLVGLVCVAAAG